MRVNGWLFHEEEEVRNKNIEIRSRGASFTNKKTRISFFVFYIPDLWHCFHRSLLHLLKIWAGVFLLPKTLKKERSSRHSPVIVMSNEERKLLDQTSLHDYIFEWGTKKDLCCMAMGYVPVYNHSYRSNCEYEMDFDNAFISIKSVRFIKAGEELFINYNGDWNDGKKLWFDAK